MISTALLTLTGCIKDDLLTEPDIPGEVAGDINDWDKTDPDDIEIY